MAELLSDFLKKEYKPEAHIIGRGILPCQGRLVLGGAPKANKSYLMLNILLDLVRGRSLFGAEYNSGKPVFPVHKSWRVLYLEMELGEQGLLERLRGSENRPGLATGLAAEGLPLYIQTRDTAMRLDTPEGRDFINQVVGSAKPDLVVFDPFAKFNLGNENDVQEMGAVLRVADHITEDFGTATAFIHHVGKMDPDPAKQKRGGDRLRGSSAIFADLDTFVEVSRLSNPHAREPVLKLSFELRRGEPIEDIFVRRMSDGHVEWLGADYSYNDPKGDGYPRSRYSKL